MQKILEPTEMDWERTKLTLSALVAFVGGAWLSLAVAVQALLILQAIDLLSGLFAAAANGGLDSRIGRAGLARKGFVWLIILSVAALAPVLGDVALTLPGVGKIGPAEGVALFYAAMEGLSILENAGQAGVPVPAAIRDRLSQLKAQAGVSAEVKAGDATVKIQTGGSAPQATASAEAGKIEIKVEPQPHEPPAR